MVCNSGSKRPSEYGHSAHINKFSDLINIIKWDYGRAKLAFCIILYIVQAISTNQFQTNSGRIVCSSLSPSKHFLVFNINPHIFWNVVSHFLDIFVKKCKISCRWIKYVPRLFAGLPE
jgi:hypothetical protein